MARAESKPDCQFSLARFGVEPHDWLNALWRDVVRGRQVSIVKFIKHVCVVRLHKLSDALLVRSSTVSSAHFTPDYPTTLPRIDLAN